MSTESPIILQRGCRVEFRLRSSIAVGEEHPGADIDFDAALKRARLVFDTDPDARVQVDLYCVYEVQGMNEEAVVHVRGGSRADKGEKRLATFEVFRDEALLCPANQRRLDPRMFATAAEALANEAPA